MKNTTLCYLERDGAYLMLHRVKKENDENRDKWIGVGGKFKAAESPFDCARREVFEETGLTLSSLKYRGIVTFVSDEFGTEYMHLFTSDNFSGKTREDCDEGILEWVKKDKISELNLWEGDKLFLELLKTEERFFSLKLTYSGERLVSHVLEL